ncbi:head maturation protease, ClpP-related [Clostridium merdae]|uniref:head maturation protease, ClpP-related n=1 Tax=Clostridium merdae TaxID=1958780 RepID=UPI000A268851|nr:head maturation protease, ClpP-related [Clostridium merdae]
MKKYYSLATAGREADLYIFGDIVDAFETGLNQAWGLDGLGEVSSLSIANEIKSLDVDTINVRINSCGGYTSEGLAICNTLKSHPAKIVTYCDGFACSAASIVFMAGEERIMGAASALMIHNAWNQAVGNAAQLRQHAERLEKISQAAGNAYAEKVKISREELDAMLDGENHEGTWILPDEAVKMGFATSVLSEQTSDIANQSAMSMILEKVTARSAQTAATIHIEAEKVADIVMQKITAAAKQEPAISTENNTMKFLNALLGGKD